MNPPHIGSEPKHNRSRCNLIAHSPRHLGDKQEVRTYLASPLKNPGSDLLASLLFASGASSRKTKVCLDTGHRLKDENTMALL